MFKTWTQERLRSVPALFLQTMGMTDARLLFRERDTPLPRVPASCVSVANVQGVLDPFGGTRHDHNVPAKSILIVYHASKYNTLHLMDRYFVSDCRGRCPCRQYSYATSLMMRP